MARTYTTSEIRLRALKATDHENDTFIAAAEAYEILSVAYGIFWAKLVDAHPGYIAEATPDSWTANGLIHALPAGCGRIIAVEYQYSSTEYIDIPEVRPADVSLFGRVSVGSYPWSTHYRMDGENVHLIPAVTSGTYRVRYYAAPAKFSTGSETIDGVAGWDDFCALHLQAYIKRKEETDDKPYLRAIAVIEEHLDTERAQRVMMKPGTVRDVDEDNYPQRFLRRWP